MCDTAREMSRLRAVFEAALLDLVRLLRLFFLVLDVAAHQEHEIRPHRSLFGGDGAGLLLERRRRRVHVPRSRSRLIFTTIICWLSA